MTNRAHLERLTEDILAQAIALTDRYALVLHYPIYRATPVDKTMVKRAPPAKLVWRLRWRLPLWRTSRLARCLWIWRRSKTQPSFPLALAYALGLREAGRDPSATR